MKNKKTKLILFLSSVIIVVVCIAVTRFSPGATDIIYSSISNEQVSMNVLSSTYEINGDNQLLDIAPTELSADLQRYEKVEAGCLAYYGLAEKISYSPVMRYYNLKTKDNTVVAMNLRISNPYITYYIPPSKELLNRHAIELEMKLDPEVCQVKSEGWTGSEW